MKVDDGNVTVVDSEFDHHDSDNPRCDSSRMLLLMQKWDKGKVGTLHKLGSRSSGYCFYEGMPRSSV